MTALHNPNPALMPCHHVLKDPSITVCSVCRPFIEIPEDKDSTLYTANIRATLASNNLPSTSVKENKKLLEAFAGITGKKVIYMKRDRFVKSSLAATVPSVPSVPSVPLAPKPAAKKQGFRLSSKSMKE